MNSAVRLSLDPALSRRAAVDGGWWPYSRDAAAELPGLIAAVDQRLGRTTLRVGLHLDAWDNIPRRVPARGRQVRVGWVRSSNPSVVTLVLLDAEPIHLLLVSPDTAEGPAGAALELAAAGTGLHRPIDILAAAHHTPASEGGGPAASGQAMWENEGGPVAGRSAR